jgi:hypothetical protein
LEHGGEECLDVVVMFGFQVILNYLDASCCLQGVDAFDVIHFMLKYPSLKVLEFALLL